MDNLISQHIQANDFKRSGFKIVFKNETSKTVFLKHEYIILKEIKENGISIELPVNVCQRGHQLTLFFFDFNHNFPKKNLTPSIFKEAKFEISAKVDSLQILQNENNTVSIDIIFNQYDIKNWKKIITDCSRKQDQINELLSKQHDRTK